MSLKIKLRLKSHLISNQTASPLSQHTSCLKNNDMKEAEITEKEPEIMEKEPEIMEKEPEVVMKEPEIVMKEPEVVMEEPEVVMEEPEVVMEEPEVVMEEPEVVMEEPEIMEKEPEIMEKEPEITEKEPEITEKEPEITEKEPEITEKEPEITDDISIKNGVELDLTNITSEILTPIVENSKVSLRESVMDKIKRFQMMPCYKQKSQQWLTQRNDYLTASTIAAAIGVMGTVARNNLLIHKVSNGSFNSFTGNTATHWGNKYEPVANGVYAYRNQVKIYSFGMITNEKYPILGISPDGITEEKMLEIKCPWSRVIDGKIKTEYYHQMQEQMAVCEFDKCDFLECRFEEITEPCFWDDFDYYNEKENINREKGIIISYINLLEEDIEYVYSPIDYYQDINEIKDWEKKTIDQLLCDNNTIYLNRSYWYLVKYNCQLVKRDPYWITEYYPVLRKFWDEVEYYRKIGFDVLLDKINKNKPNKSDSDQESETPKIDEYFAKSGSQSLTISRQTKSKNRCLL